MVGNVRFVLGLVAAVAFSTAAMAEQPMPASPQPDAASLKSGLAVNYYLAKFNSIDELISWMDYKKGKPGKPIEQLDYKVGLGKVLTSNSKDYVGAHIVGFIHLEKTGTYNFEVTSNDGVSITLGGEIIFEDPEVHPDSVSDPIPVNVTTPGWYELDILYFEKKNTSTLKLKWQPPGANGYEPVPPAALKNAGVTSS